MIYIMDRIKENNRATKQKGGANMNGYKAFYKGKQLEVYAESSYEAQLKAAKEFKAKKSYEVTVVLCEKNGDEVIHVADF